MKKLKLLFSALLVCILAISGGMCLSGCKDKENVDCRVKEVNVVLNNLEKELTRMQTFEINSTIDPSYAAEIEFQRYYVTGGIELTTRSNGYLEAHIEFIDKVLKQCRNMVNNKDFQFDTFCSGTGNSPFYLLNYTDEKIRLVYMLVDIEASDAEYYIDVTDIYYNSKSEVTYIERNEYNSDYFLVFEKTTMAVDYNQFIASHIKLSSSGSPANESSYYFAGTSERTGIQHIGFATEGNTKDVVKAKLEQVKEILNQYKFNPKNVLILE